MLRRPGLVTCLLLAVLLAVVAPPSYADSWSSPDPAGDATNFQYSPEPEPCGTSTETPATEGDLRRISIRHSRRLIILKMHVDELNRPHQTRAVFDLVTPDREWNVDVDRSRGRTEVSYYRAPQIDEDDVDECGFYGYAVGLRTCAGATATIDKVAGLITATLPRACFGTPRWVRVGGQVYGGGNGPHGFSDVWLPRGFDGDYFEPLVGRRVFAGPRG